MISWCTSCKEARDPALGTCPICDSWLWLLPDGPEEPVIDLTAAQYEAERHHAAVERVLGARPPVDHGR